MNRDHPGAAPNCPDEAFVKGTERLQISATEVQAKGEAEAAAVIAAREAEEVAEADLQAMTEHVMDKTDADAGTCFGIPVPNHMLPVEVARILCEIKAEKGLPVETLPDVMVGPMLKLQIDEAAELEAAEAKETSRDSYAEWRAQFSTNTEAVLAADSLETRGDPKLEAERLRLLGFQRILTIAQHNKADGERIAAALNNLDLTNGSSQPRVFIQQFVFSSPDHDSGISEATQAAIAKEFKLTPHRVVTGSDYEDAMNAMVTGEDGKQAPAYPEHNSLKFGVGLEGYTSDNGQQQFMKATPTHGHPITVDVTSFSPGRKALVAGYLDAWRMAEDAGATDFLISMTQYDLRGQSVLDEIQLIKAAQILNALYGGFTGHNGEVLRGGDKIAQTRWMAQLKSPKGDAARSDRNASMTDDALRGLGIRDEKGNLDIDLLRAFGDYSRDNWFGAPDYDAVQAHLTGLFPEKFRLSNG